MKLEIKEPCHENWNNMKIGLISRHCDVCDKSVMDFTKMDRGEIITYILSNPNENVCGRLNKDQFDFHHDDIPILIEALRRQKPSNAFLILTLVSMSLVSCSDTNGNHGSGATLGEPRIEIPKDSVSHLPQDSIPTVDSVDNVEVPITPAPMPPEMGEMVTTLGEIEPPVAGGICIVPDPEIEVVEPEPPAQEDRIHQFVDVMPEYPGGTEALYDFIQKNLKYPTYEKNNNIQGNVYARFVVEKDGSISNIEILRSVAGSKNFDKEVRRVISAMPKWVPGKQNGKTVRTYMTLPFRFQLTD
jgi:TonB family protein